MKNSTIIHFRKNSYRNGYFDFFFKLENKMLGPKIKIIFLNYYGYSARMH